MQQRYRLADHAINYDSRITHHPNIHQVHLPNVNPLVNLYSYIQLSLHYCASCMTSRVRPLTSMPQGTRDHISASSATSHSDTLLQSFPSSPAPLILPTQSARTGSHNGYPLANCNRANKSNKDSARKKPTSYRSSWVHRHSTKHATRHILEAQCAFKVLMIPKSCNSHYVSHFAAFFIVVGA